MEANHQQHATLLTLNGIAVNLGGSQVLDNIHLIIHEQEQWAIIGHSGSGKTTLAHIFQGKVFYRGELVYHFPENSTAHIELVEQQHHFKNLSNTSSFYYQQRFNASEADDSITVAGALEGYSDKENWITLLHLNTLLQEPLLQLSNGENKRLQLAKALLANPALLILDNPFLGLDAEGRKTLHEILGNICSKGIHIILSTSPTELPACITHVAILEKGQLISDKKNILLSIFLFNTLIGAYLPKPVNFRLFKDFINARDSFKQLMITTRSLQGAFKDHYKHPFSR